MFDATEISDHLLPILKADFHAVEIVEVRVSSDVDFEGDDILRVEVIFKGQPKDLDGGTASQAIRKMMPALREMGAFAFPALSFMSYDDAGIAARA